MGGPNLSVRRTNLAPPMGFPLRNRPTAIEVAAPTMANSGKAMVRDAHHGCWDE